jgi:hypothetical protein
MTIKIWRKKELPKFMLHGCADELKEIVFVGGNILEVRNTQVMTKVTPSKLH